MNEGQQSEVIKALSAGLLKKIKSTDESVGEQIVIQKLIKQIDEKQQLLQAPPKKSATMPKRADAIVAMAFKQALAK